MRIAFLGGTRFIGHAAARRALAARHDVILLHRGVHPNDLPGAREILVERTDIVALRAAVEQVAPDVLVDMRAMTSDDAAACADAIGVLGIPVIVISSQDVYAQFDRLNGHAAPDPEEQVRETSPLGRPYPFRGLCAHEGGPDYDKKDVERTFTERVKRVTVLRLPAVYGSRDPTRRFGEVVDAIDDAHVRNVPCVLPCSSGACFRWTVAHVSDVAHAIVFAAEARVDGQEIFNLGERATPTMRERADAIAAGMGTQITWEERPTLPPAFEHYGVMPNDFVASSTKFRKRLGFVEITTDAERLVDLVGWLRGSRAILPAT